MTTEFFLLISLLTVAAFIFLFFVYATIVSLIENEKRAASRFLFLSILIPLFYLLPIYLGISEYEYLSLGILLFTIIFVFVIFIPIRGSQKLEIEDAKGRIDERDIVFSRRKLKEGTERHTEYYKRRPKNLNPDNEFKSKPGLCSPGSIYYDPTLFTATDATFQTIEPLMSVVDGEKSDDIKNYDPKEFTTFLKNWLKHLGALDSGVCLLKEEHLYSVRGREFNYDEVVEKKHKYAIAFSVEMDHAMTAAGPKAATVMESAQQYLNSGTISIQIANFIRALGHDAKAHIDGNYEVLCPLVAKDAGLGEIGRMGLLMTPKLGPRVRLGVITTNIPLEINEKHEEKTMIDFCNRCMKCAEVCPSNSISFEDRELINGVKRWQIDSTSCFTLWCTAGTDCGRCMSVCPYSHPDNLLHNIIRFGIRNNFLFRRMAIWLDDYFYGKKPMSKESPKWMNIKEL